MDNAMTFQMTSRHWLLAVSFLLCLSQCSPVMANPGGRVCPQGQLLHQGPGLYRPHCCYPTRCGVGHQVKPCTVNGTADTCEQCIAGRNQSLRTSSYTMERCVYWSLDQDCTIGGSLKEALLVSPNNTKRCMCNIENGLIFDPPENILNAPQDAFCQRMSQCDAGKEPTVERKCRFCQKGYFKSRKSHKLCEPKTNCSKLGLEFTFYSEDTRIDHNCSVPEPITTPKPIVTEKPTTQQEVKPPPAVVPSTHSTTPSSTLSGNSAKPGLSTGPESGASDGDGANLMPLIMVVPLVLVIAVTVGVIIFCKKRRNLQICRCDANEPCNDQEKYLGQSGTTTLNDDHSHTHSGHNKPGLTQNGIIPNHLGTVNGSKPMNNNINGGHAITSGLPPVHPLGQPNGDMRGRYPSDSEPPVAYQNSRAYPPTSNGINGLPTSRAGILRNGQGMRGEHVVYGQSGARGGGGGPEMSLDSIAQEKKLMVDMDGMEANPDLGESDPLLVTESPRGVHFQDSHFQNMAASPGNSPPILSGAGINNNPVRFIHSGAGVSVAAPGPFVASNALNAMAMAPAPTQPSPPTTQVTFGPSGAVTFTRSTSVIASPEGEVEEEEMEALVPRFSQLLPDGEDANSAASSIREQPTNPIVRLMQEREVVPGRSDSPMRETTQQVRNPAERIHMYNPYHNPAAQQFRSPGSPANAQQQQQHNRGVRPGNPPAPSDPQRAPAAGHNELPDHCIMELKEQQLAESLPSSPTSPMQTQPKTLQDSNPEPLEPDLFKGREVHPSEQTELKTQGGKEGSGSLEKDPAHLADKTGASAETKLMKAHDGSPGEPQDKREPSPLNSEATFVKQGPLVGKVGGETTSANPASERKRTASGNSQGSRASAGTTGSGSAHNTLERQPRHRVPSGDQQVTRAPCLRSGSTDDGSSAASKHGYGRTVSFEDEGGEDKTGRLPRGHHPEPKQHSPSHSGGLGNAPGVTNVNSNSQERLDTQGRVLLRGLSDSDREPGFSEDDTKSEDEVESVLRGSSKSSVTSEGSESNTSSPAKTNVYHRSQSENAPSSSESQPKPPPRSMSEEKPQKQDRPIAKVKPMPASDNQLPVEVSDDTDLPRTLAQAGGGNYNNLMDYSSEDSDAEEDARRVQFEEATAVLQEDAEEESEEDRDMPEEETIDRH